MRSWPRDTWNQEQCQLWRKSRLGNHLDGALVKSPGEPPFTHHRADLFFQNPARKCEMLRHIKNISGEARWQGKSLLIVYLFNSWINTLKQQVSPATPTQSEIYMDLAELSFNLENKNVVIGKKKSTGQRRQSQKWPNYSNIQVLRCIHMNHSSRYTSHWFTTNHMLLMEPSWPFFKRNLGLLSSSCSRLVLRNNWNPSAVSEKEKRWSNRPCFKKKNNGQSIALLNGRSGKKRQLVFQTWKRQVMVQRKFGNLFKWIFRIVVPRIHLRKNSHR